MSNKHRRMVIMDDKYIDADKIMITEDIYLAIKNVFKKQNKSNTISHMRDIVYEGKCLGSFKSHNVDGYKFQWKDESVIVDVSGVKFLYASKDNKESNIMKQVKSEPSHKINLTSNNPEPTDHFIQRISERFFVTDINMARKFIQNVITNGEYIGTQPDKDSGIEAHMYLHDGISVFVSLDRKTAITTYRQEKVIHGEPRDEIKKLLNKRINGIKKYKRSVDKRSIEYSLDVKIEIAELERTMYYTKSQSKKMSCQARIQALKTLIKDMELERKNINERLRNYNKTMTSVLSR